MGDPSELFEFDFGPKCSKENRGGFGIDEDHLSAFFPSVSQSDLGSHFDAVREMFGTSFGGFCQ